MASADPYDRWKADPSSDNLFAVVQKLKPTIESVMASYGASGNPHIAAKARVVAAKAIQSYNPEHGASLATWTSQQLRQLVRDVRKSNSPVRVPDGVQLDAFSIYKAERELEDKLDREPTMEEVADACHLSVKRIRDVRKKMRKIGQETSPDPEQATQDLAGAETDYSKEAIEYVYNSSNTVEKKVLEYTTGFNGEAPLPTSAIKQKLKLTDVQLSRIRARLGLRVRDIINDLESVQQ